MLAFDADRLGRRLPPVVHGVLLDNMTPDLIREAVGLIDDHPASLVIEVSGGVTFATLRDYALSGVDIISVGALTHSVRAVDLGAGDCLECRRDELVHTRLVMGDERRCNACLCADRPQRQPRKPVGTSDLTCGGADLVRPFLGRLAGCARPALRDHHPAIIVPGHHLVNRY